MNFYKEKKIKEVKNELSQFKKKFDNEILNFLKKEKPWSILKWIYYYIWIGGKRIRPFIAYKTIKYYKQDPWKFKHLLFALEIYHNSILILDDVQDNDELRRNKPSLWKLIGKAQAINVGFYGLLYVADLIDKLDLEKEKKEEIVKVFDFVTKKTVEGQFLDFHLEKNWKKMDKKTLLKTYLKMNILKTAYYLALPLISTLRIFENDKNKEKKLFKDLIYVGLLFQVMNDLEDFIERQSDFKRGLPTLPIILALDEDKDIKKAVEKFKKNKRLKEKIKNFANKLEKKLEFEISKEILLLIKEKIDKTLSSL